MGDDRLRHDEVEASVEHGAVEIGVVGEQWRLQRTQLAAGFMCEPVLDQPVMRLDAEIFSAQQERNQAPSKAQGTAAEIEDRVGFLKPESGQQVHLQQTQKAIPAGRTHISAVVVVASLEGVGVSSGQMTGHERLLQVQELYQRLARTGTDQTALAPLNACRASGMTDALGEGMPSSPFPDLQEVCA